jgi:wyosine [tRNA(Phe)-imidazoG37] synthetase (radical SAM superfamily)
VLTNGSLLWDPEVRAQLAQADLVIPSLDAGDAETFKTVNRPVPEVGFEKMLEGLIRFRKGFTNPLWLEVLLMEGINTSEVALDRLARCIRQIAPDRVQLNTATRPPAERSAIRVEPARLQEIAGRFSPVAEVIADYRQVHAQSDFAGHKDAVLELLSRRPCTVEGVADGLGLHRNEAVKYIEELISAGKLCVKKSGAEKFYTVKWSEHNHTERSRR